MNIGCVETPVRCDDGSDCTFDACNNKTGCSFTPTLCGTLSSPSLPPLSALLSFYQFNSIIDDGNACTRDYCRVSGGCGAEDISILCNDILPILLLSPLALSPLPLVIVLNDYIHITTRVRSIAATLGLVAYTKL